ncbi:hypothetical protein ACFVYJ_01575 [Pontibacter sp. JAM-7]|uniref:hypothetical protein n=1 Tax=Pontibacter sp. JAM-7 TaxID=3366581 RepID=UPI003AF5BF18
MDVADVREQMAYDLLQDEDFRKRLEREAELEASRQLTPEQQAEKMKNHLGKRHGNHQ